MIYAKISTAKTVTFGPVLAADGTMSNGALAYTDAKIFKNGTDGALDASATFTHKYEGVYALALTANDLNAVGTFEVVLNKNPLSAAPVKIIVLSASVYDWLFGTAVGIPSVTPGAANGLPINGTNAGATTFNSWAAVTTMTINGASVVTGAMLPEDFSTLDITTIATVANQTAILNAIANLNNLSALINVYGPYVLEIPDSSSTAYPFTIVVRDNEGKLVNLDAPPTITAANAAGTDRSANLSAVSSPSTGRYTFTYTVASNATEEGVRITASGAVSAEARYIEHVVSIVDYDTLTTLNAINTKLGTPAGASIAADVAAVKTDTAAIKAKTDNLPATPAAASDIPSTSAINAALSTAHGSGAWGSSAGGTGSVVVNHDTGGTDNLRFTYNGTGLDNAIIRAYLTDDYDTGDRTIIGQSVTNVEGRWATDMMLDANDYTITFEKDGYALTVAEVTVA